jgi:hypothetical protein
VLAIVIGLAFYGRIRGAIVASLVAAVTSLGLAAVPLSLGVSSLMSGYFRGTSTSTEEAVSRTLGFSPETLVRMSVSGRGLFVWTPVTLLGAIGFILLLHERRDARPFFVITGAMGLALVLPYAFVEFLTPSYSQRYWTPLFPIVVLGIAGLLAKNPKVAGPVTAAAVVWSLALAFYTAPGLGYSDDSAFHFPERVVTGEIAPSHYAHLVFHRSRLLDLLPDPWDHG